MRINAFLSLAGVASRRKADEYIKDGRVSVNGHKAQLNSQVNESDIVLLDNKSLQLQPYKYVILNKPTGYVTTMDDPEGRAKVTDLIKTEESLKPIGRLDMNTSGLLLLTNDGQTANNLMHPSKNLDKTYQIKVKGVINPEVIRKLSEGVMLDDGITAPAKATKLDDNTIKLVIHEGRNRQVRRMIEAVGLQLKGLIRVEYGPLSLAGLASGKWRYLTNEEITALKNAKMTK